MPDDGALSGEVALPDHAAIDAAEAEALFAPFAGRRILLAVSGGPDSMAMMLLAKGAASALGLDLSVATVDHGLRPEAAADAAFVEKQATKLGLGCVVLSWRGPKPATRIQELARDARYRLLCDHGKKTGATCLMTAHTLDDQAETMLFRMARGSGLSGLTGMRVSVVREGIVHARPLLGIAKQRLIATCKSHSVVFLDDRSNRDPLYARTRWRSLMPALAEEGLTAKRLEQLARRLARADDALDARAQAVLAAAECEGGHDAALIAAEPIEIVIRLLSMLMERCKTDERPSDADEPFKHVSLSRLEALAEALHRAIADGKPLRRTLAGLVFDHHRGILKIETAPPRRSRKHLLL